MGKLHLLFRKEEIDQAKMNDKVAVVFDVLLATSTITAALADGASEVIPVLDHEEALAQARQHEPDSILLAGEYNGLPIEGFHLPNPLSLRSMVAGKTLILSTTNGTVAVRNSASAKKVYIASLLNGQAVADRIASAHHDETIVLVCSGSAGEFCMEDFYGAGYFIDTLLRNDSADWELTDAAKAAQYFYKGTEQQTAELFQHTHVGNMLLQYGAKQDLEFVAGCGVLNVIPYLNHKKGIVKEEVEDGTYSISHKRG